MSSESNKLVLIVNDNGGFHFKPFQHLGYNHTENVKLLGSAPERIALVVFTGGADVSPMIYNKDRHPRTFSSLARDTMEMDVFNQAFDCGIPMAGICRGAQFLCVMAGGMLVQDVTGHQMGLHEVEARYPDGSLKTILVRGDHHQMQFPFNMEMGTDYQLLAWGKEPRSKHYAFDSETTIKEEDATPQLRSEPDVVFYPEIKALAAQYHPEWMKRESEGFKYFTKLVDHHLVPLIENERSRKTTSQTAG